MTVTELSPAPIPTLQPSYWVEDQGCNPARHRQRRVPGEWDEDDEQPSSPQALQALNGHEYTVETLSAAEGLPPCRYCGGPITPPVQWYCEFEDGPVTDARGNGLKPSAADCQCNWCVIRRNALVREVGGQPVKCGSDECRKAHNREKQREKRARDRAKNPPKPRGRPKKNVSP
jgi:hypothetical protein